MRDRLRHRLEQLPLAEKLFAFILAGLALGTFAAVYTTYQERQDLARLFAERGCVFHEFAGSDVIPIYRCVDGYRRPWDREAFR